MTLMKANPDRHYSNPEIQVPKVNGSVDFDHPPAGIWFLPLPIRDEDVKNWDIDPAYLTHHGTGSQKRLYFMVPSHNEELYRFLMDEENGL